MPACLPPPAPPHPPTHPPLQVDACADPAVVRAVAARREQTVCISGLTGEGLPELLERVSAKLQDSMVAVHVLIPYAQGDLVDEIHRTGVVEATEFGAAGTEVRAWVPLALAQRLQPLRAAAAERAEAAETSAAAGVGAAAEAAAEAGLEADEESDGWEEWEEELSSEEEQAEEGQQLAAGKAA